jgi:hypothetical protein
MPYGKQIKITKDDDEATIEASSWKVYERNGWTRTDDGGSEAGPPAAAPQSAAPTQEG